jgi:hypothetical protein
MLRENSRRARKFLHRVPERGLVFGRMEELIDQFNRLPGALSRRARSITRSKAPTAIGFTSCAMAPVPAMPCRAELLNMSVLRR